MAEAIVMDKKRILPCAAWLQGEYGMNGFFWACLQARPQRPGAVIEVELSAEERAALEKSADAVREPMKLV